MASTLTLRQVADDLGFSYETVRQLCLGSAGDPLPFMRSSARPHARWIVPADAYQEWKARQVSTNVERHQGAGGDLHLENLKRRREIYQDQLERRRAERTAGKTVRKTQERG